MNSKQNTARWFGYSASFSYSSSISLATLFEHKDNDKNDINAWA